MIYCKVNETRFYTNIRAHFVQWAPMSPFEPHMAIIIQWKRKDVFSDPQWALMCPLESSEQQLIRLNPFEPGTKIKFMLTNLHPKFQQFSIEWFNCLNWFQPIFCKEFFQLQTVQIQGAGTELKEHLKIYDKTYRFS